VWDGHIAMVVRNWTMSEAGWEPQLNEHWVPHRQLVLVANKSE